LNILATCAEFFFFAGMKAQRDSDGGRILLGDTAGSRVVMWSVTFRCVWELCQLNVLLYTHTVYYVCTQLRLGPDFLEGDCYVHRGLYQWRTEGAGVQTPSPQNSEVLTKLSRIPSFV
jgi:hypothetical protein